MHYNTVEVELDHGRVRPHGDVTLPVKARALLAILEPDNSLPARETPSGSGMRRFLTSRDFPLTSEQFRASMEADVFEQ